MPVVTVTDLNNAKEDANDLSDLVNGFSSVETRTGGTKQSYSQYMSNITHGDITAYDPTATYTLITEWVSYVDTSVSPNTTTVYRPIPSQLPIAPTSPLTTAPDTTKWVVAAGYRLGDRIHPSVDTYAELRALPSASIPDGTIIPVAGDGIAGDFVVKTNAASPNPITDNGGTLIVFTDDSNRYERRFDGAVYASWFGVTFDGVTDDAAAIRDAWDYISPIGGTLSIQGPNGSVSKVSIINFADFNTAQVEVIGYGTTFERISTTSQYTMFPHRKNVVIKGVTIKGYIDSGTGWADVVPTSSFGFRPDSTVNTDTDIVYIDCIAYNFPHDGWYIDNENARVFLNNCSGWDCARNDFAFTHGQSVVLEGGEWGNDTTPWIKNATIDIEPNLGDECHYARVANLRAFHKVAFYGAAGTSLIQTGEMEDVIFDGTVHGAECGLRWYRVDEMKIGKYTEENGATVFQANFPGADQQAQGGFYFTNPRPFKYFTPGKNLLVNPYNSVTGWTPSIGGGTTATPNVDCHGFKGIRLDNAATSSISYRQDVAVSLAADTWFTYGGLIKLVDAVGGNAQGIRIQMDGGDSYWLHGDGYVSAAFLAPSATTTITFWFGTNSSLNLDAVFSKMFLCEGFVPPLDVPSDKTFWSAAPTTGTWAVGDKVYNSSPSVDGNNMVLDHWLCTVAGTPGTWVAQYYSTVTPAT
jgi:hypothetical protein